MVVFRHYVDRVSLLLALLESVLFGVVFVAAAWLLRLNEAASGTTWIPPITILLPTLLLLLCLTALGGYLPAVRRSARATATRLAIGGFFAVVAIILTAPLHQLFELVDERLWAYALTVAVACGLAWFCRVVFLHLPFLRDRLKPRATVIGCGTRAALVREACDGGRSPRIVSFLRPPSAGDTPAGETLAVGTISAPLALEAFPDDLCTAMTARRVRQIVVALDERRRVLPLEQLLLCRMHGISVIDSDAFLERVTGRVDLNVANQSWLIFSDGFFSNRFYDGMRRAFDILASGALLALTAPLLLLVALAVKADSPGPAIYSQERVGRRGRIFSIYKFRSMVEQAEQDGVAVFASERDPRVTRVGRWLRLTRLDELPQLFNVLKGDMSLIGPRPERPQFVHDLCGSIPFYNERHRLRPGITGWAQINHHYASTPEDNRFKTEYDLYYLKNRSLFLDLVILLQTVRIVVFREGAR
jgi:sugar transferase (PEP-CTERM system associated)